VERSRPRLRGLDLRRSNKNPVPPLRSGAHVNYFNLSQGSTSFTLGYSCLRNTVASPGLKPSSLAAKHGPEGPFFHPSLKTQYFLNRSNFLTRLRRCSFKCPKTSLFLKQTVLPWS
jgi:hypothetical protein